MLRRLQNRLDEAQGSEDPRAFQRPPDSSAPGLDLDRLLSILRRQGSAIGLCALIGLLCGVLVLLATPAKFTSTTNLLIDGKRNQARAEWGASLAELSFDSGAIDSQVEVIKSEKIALQVIRKLGLADEITFMSAGLGPIGRFTNQLAQLIPLSRLLGGSEADEAEARFQAEREAIRIIQADLEVKRLGRTFVLSVAYRAADPALAAAIARAFAEAYLDDQLEARYETARRAGDWLLTRIAELRKKSLDSDKAVQNFKSANSIAVNGAGQWVNEQQLGETNLRLIQARSDVARARAKFERVQHIIATNQNDAAVAEVLNNPVIVDLRNKMLRAAKSHADLVAKLGANHGQAQNLKAEIGEYERLIFEEFGRIAESYKSELNIALANETAIQADLAQQLSDSGVTNQVLVQLRELEREADSFKTLHQSFLQRYQENVQSQSFPINDARVISEASPALWPSHPRKSLVLLLGLVGGTGLGLGLAAWREFRDRGFRTGAQIGEQLGLAYLGALADLPRPDDASRAAETETALARQVIEAPFSGFAETLRVAKAALDAAPGAHESKVIGVMSLLPGEGKSLVAKNLASLIAQGGFSTLLIDGDLRNPTLTRRLAANANLGLADLLLDGRPLESALVREAATGLMLLPTIGARRLRHGADLLGSVRMRQLVDKARQSFDYVCVDLPPLAAVADVRAAQGLFDAFLLVIEWGKTPREALREALWRDAGLYDKIIGAVLNKVDAQAMRLYGDAAFIGYPGLGDFTPPALAANDR